MTDLHKPREVPTWYKEEPTPRLRWRPLAKLQQEADGSFSEFAENTLQQEWKISVYKGDYLDHDCYEWRDVPVE